MRISLVALWFPMFLQPITSKSALGFWALGLNACVRACVRLSVLFLDTVRKGNVGMILYRVMERASDTAAYAPLDLLASSSLLHIHTYTHTRAALVLVYPRKFPRFRTNHQSAKLGVLVKTEVDIFGVSGSSGRQYPWLDLLYLPKRGFGRLGSSRDCRKADSNSAQDRTCVRPSRNMLLLWTVSRFDVHNTRGAR